MCLYFHVSEAAVFVRLPKSTMKSLVCNLFKADSFQQRLLLKLEDFTAGFFGDWCKKDFTLLNIFIFYCYILFWEEI